MAVLLRPEPRNYDKEGWMLALRSSKIHSMTEQRTWKSGSGAFDDEDLLEHLGDPHAITGPRLSLSDKPALFAQDDDVFTAGIGAPKDKRTPDHVAPAIEHADRIVMHHIDLG